MLTNVFLAAGVAALALAVPALAGPGGGHGGGNGNGHGGGGPLAEQGGEGNNGDHGGGHGNDGGGRGPRSEQPPEGGGGPPAGMQGGGDAGHGRGHGGGGFAPQQMQQVERQQMRGFERQQFRNVDRQQSRGFERHQERNAERQQLRGFERHQQRQAEREQMRGFERQQVRHVERQQIRGFDRQQSRIAAREQMRAPDRPQFEQNAFVRNREQRSNRAVFRDSRFGQVQQRFAANDPVYAQRIAAFRNADTVYQRDRYGGLTNGCPPGLWMKNNGCLPPPGQAARLLGAPFAAASNYGSFSPLPPQLSYFYPDTNDSYYRYGDGYLYQVDRGTNLIASLRPLIGGGFVPGQYLPADYMDSYVPAEYGYDNFYPDGGSDCNRYYDSVIYQVDCGSGYVENVIPTYSGGYGVGQMLPSAYDYYNLPMQYRSTYYDTPEANYWYAPGAIYQYDPNSSVITSVAALLSPGFSVGQRLPVGYDAYNVPYDYRSTYYDTPNAMYRYNNGNIYQVDPTTQLVTAIVASLLT